MALGLLWFTRLPATPRRGSERRNSQPPSIPPAAVLIDVLPAVLLFGVGIACVVAPLTNTLMGSIPARFSGLGSAINNAIARVGQPLLGAVIFIAVSATFYATLAAARAGPRHVVGGRQGRIPAAEPATAGGDAGPDRRRGQRLDRGVPPGDGRGRGALAVGGGGLVVRAARAADGQGRRRRALTGARLGRPHLRPRRRSDDPLGHGRSSTACRWPATSGSSMPAAGPAASPSSSPSACPRGRVVALDGSPAMVDAAPRAARPLRRPDRVRRRRPRSAAADRRAGRRRPLDRDVPLGPRPRRAVPQPRGGHPSRRLARRAVRRRRQHRVGSSAPWPRSATAGSGRPISRRRWRPRAGSTRPATSTSSAG